jgi:hypothetical protein
MDDKDKEYLEKLYEGFAMAGYLINGDYTPAEIPSLAKKMAKAMMKEPSNGITAVEPKRRSK